MQSHIADWLDETAPRPVSLISACAGDGTGSSANPQALEAGVRLFEFVR